MQLGTSSAALASGVHLMLAPHNMEMYRAAGTPSCRRLMYS